METAIIIARCSTTEKKQDVTRQTKELTNKYNNTYNIKKTFAYYQSGTKNQDANKEMLSYAVTNGINHIIVSEVSRIGRKMVDVINFIEQCNNEKIDVVIDNHSLHSLNKDKSINVMTQAMLSIGATFASMELVQTKQRLDSGRKKYISEGGILGRKTGTTEDKATTLKKHNDIVKYLKHGDSIMKINQLTGKSTATVQKVKKLLAT